ncbi:MAG: hypothetical protein ACRDQH_02790 [Pseudonocardiaceae bacterium]
MPTPEEAQREILDALHDHFDRTSNRLSPEQIMEMVALDEQTTHNALRVLYRANKIEGVAAMQADHPIWITGIVYDG